MNWMVAMEGPGRLGKAEDRRQGLVRFVLSCGPFSSFLLPDSRTAAGRPIPPRQAAGGLLLESTNSLREGLGTNFQGTKNLMVYWWNPQAPEISTENSQSGLQDLVRDMRTTQGHGLSGEGSNVTERAQDK